MKKRSVRLLLELLEDRLAPASLIVNTALDTNARDNLLSLREAIMLSNGDLAYAALAPAEQAQVSNGTPGGQQADDYILNRSWCPNNFTARPGNSQRAAHNPAPGRY
jgi:hypothetical protein